MKILFFSHYFPPEVNAPASRTFEHCVRWVKEGHEVTVVTCAPNCPNGVVYPGYQNRLRSQKEVVDGIEVRRVWTYVAPNSGTFRRILNYLTYMFSALWTALWLQRPDVVIATSPQFFCGWAGVLFRWIKRVPFVLEIRDIWPESIEAVGAMQNRRALAILEAMERTMYRAADRIVTVGNGYKDNILSKVDVADRISVITNGVDLDAFQPRDPDRTWLEKYGLQDKFVCSYIGTIGMAHGLEVAVKAAELLKEMDRRDMAFCLVGDGAARESLERQVEEKGLRDWVVFTGRLPKSEVPTVLASSGACLIHLRGCELFGTVMPSKIFETLAMGKTIIMGVRGEACDIVMDSGAGLEMEPDSPESLVQIVETLSEEPEDLAERQFAAREYVAKYYNRDVLAKRFLQILHDLTQTDSDGTRQDASSCQTCSCAESHAERDVAEAERR